MMNRQDYKNVSKQVDEFSRDFRDRLGVQNFWISRYYFNGDVVCYGTDVEWNDIALAQNWYSCFATDLLKSASNGKKNLTNIHWSSETNQCPDVLRAIREHNCSLSGFNLIKWNDDHVETYGFATTKTINDLQGVLFSNVTDINLFLLRAQAFQKSLPIVKFDGLLEKSWSQPIEKMKGDTDINSVPVTLYGLTANLSLRQIEILIHLAFGKGYKTVAHDMDISVKTVEYHVIEIRRAFKNLPLVMLITELHQSGNFALLQSLVGC